MRCSNALRRWCDRFLELKARGKDGQDAGRGVVLDPFGGSATTIIAAEKTGRRARAIELDPKYVDVAVRPWERYTGKTAVLDGTGQTFEDVEAARAAANDSAVAREAAA